MCSGGVGAALGFVLVSDVCWAAGASSAGVLLIPSWGRLELGGGPQYLSPYVPFPMAETCTNSMAFFHTEQGCFSTCLPSHVYLHTFGSLHASKGPQLVYWGDRCSSLPLPKYFSVSSSVESCGTEQGLAWPHLPSP